MKTLGWGEGYHGRIHGLVDVDVEPLVDGKCVFLDVDVLMFVLVMLVVLLIAREWWEPDIGPPEPFPSRTQGNHLTIIVRPVGGALASLTLS